MAKLLPTPTSQLAAMLAKFDPAMEKFGKAAYKKMRTLLPTATQMVYDNYNFFVIGFGPTDRASQAICSIAMDAHGVRLCFLWGVGLPDPEGLLRGGGNQVRNVWLDSATTLDRPAVKALITEAVLRSKVPMPESGKGSLIIKSISAKQRPRRLPEKLATKSKLKTKTKTKTNTKTKTKTKPKTKM